ncbi:MAG: hypothetical protein NDI61_03335 [Bdellovibrionaceae bacterium]|nr:hypothetical protein [Pseudobdellovibrionaceae bacterium]
MKIGQRLGIWKLVLTVTILVAATLNISLSSIVQAQEVDEMSAYPDDIHTGVPETTDRRPASSTRVGQVASEQLNRARYRLYPGGQDEEDLKVQESLPLPTRNPDGSPVGPVATETQDD